MSKTALTSALDVTPSLRRRAALGIAGLSVLCSVAVAAPASAVTVGADVTRINGSAAQANCSDGCGPALRMIKPANGTAVKALCWSKNQLMHGNYWSSKYYLVSVQGQPLNAHWSINSSYLASQPRVPECALTIRRTITVRH